MPQTFIIAAVPKTGFETTNFRLQGFYDGLKITVSPFRKFKAKT